MCQRQVWVLRFFVYQLLGKFGLCFFCQILFIFPPFQPHFGSRVSPCVRDKVVRLLNPTAYDLCCINTPSSFPTKTVQLARSPTFIGRLDFTKYKGGGFDLYFLKEGRYERLFMFLLPIFFIHDIFSCQEILVYVSLANLCSCVFYVTFLQVMMERISQMYNLSRLDPSYISEVHRFIVVATNHAWRTKTKHIYCPCMDCKNAVVFDDTE